MLNVKILRILCLFCVAACFLSLLGCAKEDPKDAIVTFPEDVSAIADFKCVCATDRETEFVIENGEAKALYTYISKQFEKAEEAEETNVDKAEQDYIYLAFQDGDPWLTGNQEPKAEISDSFTAADEHFYGVFGSSAVTSMEMPTVADEHFYGVFWIHENDYMVYTATPVTSFQVYYKMPAGTYDKIAELLKLQPI